MSGLLTAENIIALISLTALEIVLGIDNIVFIAILVGKLPQQQRALARRVGLMLAMVMRILLLLGISWVTHLTNPLFHILERGISGRDLILFCGGLFLIGKATFEIHERLEGPHDAALHVKKRKFAGLIAQIVVLDIVFSLDSVITAVGMSNHLGVMILAIVIAVGVMLLFAGSISHFIELHPTLKVLALSFLLLVGLLLVAEGVGQHIDRGYIYFAMGFSLLVEMLNIRISKKKERQLQRA